MPSHFASSFCPHIVTYPVRLRLLSALHWYYPLVLVTSSLSQLKHTDLWLSGTFVFVSSTADDGAAWTHVLRCFLSLTQSAACRTSLPLCSKSSFTQSIHLFFCLPVANAIVGNLEQSILMGYSYPYFVKPRNPTWPKGVENDAYARPPWELDTGRVHLRVGTRVGLGHKIICLRWIGFNVKNF